MREKTALTLALCGTLLCGCAHNYVVKLSNGTQFTTASKPKLKGNSYYYKDASGREHSIPQGRVSEIAPASMVEEENSWNRPETPKKKWYWPF